MAIEFRCTQCQKLLRVADDTAGKQAKCPSCGAVLTIPPPAAPGQEATPGINPFGDFSPAAPPPGGAGFGPPGGPGPGPTGYPAQPEEPVNPYQSPLAVAEPSPFTPSTTPRTGPPWERDGASFRSFVETIKVCFSSPTAFYDDLRREGGLGRPLWFAVIGGSLGIFAAMLFNLVLQGAIAAAAGNRQQFTVQLGVTGCYIALAPLIIAAAAFINGGIYHLMLMLFKGANFPYETTFRVVAYTSGAVAMLALVPCVGGYASAIVQIVFVIIGLSRAQEISGGKASAVVLVPIGVCVCGSLAIAGVIVAIAMSQSGAFR